MKTPYTLFVSCFLLLFTSIITACSERSRITSRQHDIKAKIESCREASLRMLLSEDLVDSPRYQVDSVYRIAIMKQAQGWILTSDSLLREAEKMQAIYDSLETERYLLDH